MAEIGATLREARMRAGIDIAEVESRTKIRAKYLRALENEEWSLLPGTTFVKSFLRTYAEALGLDAKLLVEEYKFRHEPYESSSGGTTPKGRRGGSRRGGGAFGPPKRTNVLPILLLLVLVAGAVFAVIRLSQGEDSPVTPAGTTTEVPRQEPASDADAREERAAAAVITLRVTAGSEEGATVCVNDARGRRVIDGQQLEPKRRTKPVRSRSFKVAIDSDQARVTVGGRRLRLRADNRGIVAYEITKGSRKRLARADRPSCSR
jgi:transcriptional regulator with XRE-family HTH domain